MPNFENELTKAINRSFGEEGIACRRKQAKYTNQIFDILVDHPKNYIAIECKSIKASSTNKLYWSQHFSDNQIEKESNFLKKSGRNGFLAVELRRGRGKPKEAYLYGWLDLLDYYRTKKGISIEDVIEFGMEVCREEGEYKIDLFQS